MSTSMAAPASANAFSDLIPPVVNALLFLIALYFDSEFLQASLLTAAVAGTLVWIKRADREQFVLANPTMFLGLIVLMTYAAPALLWTSGALPFSIFVAAFDRQYLGTALQLVFLGWTCFVAGRAFEIWNAGEIVHFSQDRVQGFFTAPGAQTTTTICLAACSIAALVMIARIGGIPTKYMEISDSSSLNNSSGMVVMTVYQACFAGAALYVAARHFARPALSLTAAAALFAVIQILMIAGAGSKEPIVSLGVAAVFGIELASEGLTFKADARKILFRGYGLLAAAIIVGFVVVEPLRVAERTTGAVASQSSTSDRIRTQVDLFGNVLLHPFEAVPGGPGTFERITTRLSSVSALSRVVAYLDNKSRYEGLSSVPLVPLYTILPRSLFPEKTTFINSGEFAHLNGWEFGGLSVTFPGSLFWVGGWPGVALGFLVFGYAANRLWRKAANLQTKYVCLCCVFAMSLWEPEWDAMVITLIRYFLVLSAIDLIAGMNSTPADLPGPMYFHDPDRQTVAGAAAMTGEF